MRRAWRVAHVAATVAIPWMLAVYYWTSADRYTIEGSGRVAAHFHMAAAIAAAVLFVDAVVLRVIGRSAAATVPFAIVWAGALAYSLNGIRTFSGKEFKDYCGNVELCIPDLDLFVGAVPFALAMSCAAVCSIVVDRKRRSERLTVEAIHNG
ncbi:hypothetical protein GOSPT_050_00200 [Gordonia sputi NBRC 100414]|uniref:Integral membrane protein n=1 Tax=Gordonia sputi NBRC 100414 TaxID=1089453 RepID=H5TZ30_9ACTN|nr:hypothetical protein A5766_11715 [Gordonia sp. 852002-51296_SCH5728562-b]GAB38738.1 hypothetical protein GOSPT_050_00200 [Gordonia sputi NBRC 100414]